MYVVNRGQITVLDLMQLPALTPRQIEALARVEGLGNAPSGMSKCGRALLCVCVCVCVCSSVNEQSCWRPYGMRVAPMGPATDGIAPATPPP